VVAKGFVSVAVAFLALPTLALAAPGDLDTTYGNGGRVEVPGPGTEGLALAPNGDAVVAGAGGLDAEPDLSHVRVTPAGALAPGYQGGRVRTIFEPYHHTTVAAVATDAAGRVVVGGSVRNRGSADYSAYAFARYLGDGRPDRSFGTNGVVILELQETVEQVGDLAVDSAGRIVFASARAYDPVVGRLTPDGRLDPTFAGGWVRLGPATGGVIDSGYPLAVLADGGVVVLGGDGLHTAVVRLAPDGRLDDAFGDGGVAVFGDDAPSWPDVGAANIAPAPGDGFVLAGSADVGGEHEGRLWAMRVHADGSIDPAFGGPTGASVHVPIPPRSDQHPEYLEGGAADVAVQADGKVVLAGHFKDDSDGHVRTHGVLARLLPNGAPDPGFGGGDGLTIVTDGEYGLSDVVIQRDGRILASTPGAFNVMRFEGGGAPYEPAATHSPTRFDTAATSPAIKRTARTWRIAVNARGRARLSVPCAARRCVVRLRIGRTVVAKTRATRVRRVTVRLPHRIVRRLDRRGELAARLEIRFGARRVVRHVSLLPSGAP
jgi:uncharacterized delta-60 repeat protein